MRVEYAAHNAKMYQVRPERIAFEAKDILKVDFTKYFDSHESKSVAFFFDPPWGGVNYQENEEMEFKDLNYPMKEALVKAFTITSNIMLKLPKLMNLEQCYTDIIESYATAMNLNKKRIADNFEIQAVMICQKS